ncbi:branched-chain amino acid transport system II carrier protein [Selenomonas sp. F0473]|uniref:branched-chain amino acid transport system II carrier protein n=1 Tax=Selenomonas sp. F0473 TaxID=999423 RepID=UPI0025F8E040|nr:branched-chain amino acid transport system II carrier protein [Selenomonas sp. F0473]
MKRRLRKKEYLLVASMLFGLLFGAGNLIFPAAMGQAAGSEMIPALVGFCITGVGLPLLAVTAMSLSASEDLFAMGAKVGRSFAYFFTCALYLCIGPLFAIPRTATVSFQVGVVPFVSPAGQSAALLVFSLLFFAVTLCFSFRPSGILTWVGKVLTPLFLFFLGILICAAVLSPMGGAAASPPTEAYASHSFFKGLLEGYNTMDVLGVLAYGNILIRSVRLLGLSEPRDISYGTIVSGSFSALLMVAVYGALTYVGAQSRSVYGIDANGGDVLHHIALHYFGDFGSILLGITITFACLKTSVGLITACSAAFAGLFPRACSYRVYVISFCLFSCAVANVGLSRIIDYALPALYFLYPISMTLIILCLLEARIGYRRSVFICGIVGTSAAAIFDLLRVLPPAAGDILPAYALLCAVGAALPFSSLGMGWMLPAAAGILIGTCAAYIRDRRSAK